MNKHLKVAIMGAFAGSLVQNICSPENKDVPFQFSATIGAFDLTIIKNTKAQTIYIKVIKNGDLLLDKTIAISIEKISLELQEIMTIFNI